MIFPSPRYRRPMARACLVLAGLLLALPVGSTGLAEDCPPADGTVVREYSVEKDPNSFSGLTPARPEPGSLPFDITPDGPIATREEVPFPGDSLPPVPRHAASAPSLFRHAVPTLGELRKPVEEAPPPVEEEPEAPAPVPPQERRTDLQGHFPDGPFWYAEVADAGLARSQWAASPPGRFLAEPALEQTFRNNRFGLDLLLSDLPASVIDKARVSAVATAFDLAEPLAGIANSLAGAAYLDDDGTFRFLFLFDTGLDREPAFDIMSRWETTFHLTHPGSHAVRGNRRERHYLDTVTVKGSSVLHPAEVAFGFIDNLTVVSNDPLLARRALELAADPGRDGSVAASRYGQRLHVSQGETTDVAAVGFLRIDMLLSRLGGTTAREAVGRWADFLGQGGRNGEALYYGATLDEDAIRETILVPAQGTAASSSLIEVIGRRLRPASRWTTPGILPYQPSPTLFFAGMMEGRQLGGILRQERRLFGVSREDYFLLPATARRLFLTNDLLAVLTGEFGLAFYPGPEDESRWLLILPCTENPESLLPRADNRVDRSGAVINSPESDWRTNLAWTVLSSDTFRGIGGQYLVIASNGELVLSTIDQILAGSSLTDNRDFAKGMSAVEAEPGLVFYLNLPEILIRQYPNFSSLMRAYYPRSSGFNSRPPLSLLRRYGEGVVGSLRPAGRDDEFIRLAVRSPAPILGVVAGGIVLDFPRELRESGRQAMEQSRSNLQNLWLRLQLFSSRFGHFPDSLDDLQRDMRRSAVENVDNTFIAPAALSRLDREQALAGSYRYLSGVTPNDEPDLPLLYEAEPWSEDFSGMYPGDPNRSRSESGDFVRFRQYIRLDGRIITLPEKRFQAEIVPRMVERE